MTHKSLRKRLKRLNAREFEDAWKTNVEMERIEIDTISTRGRPTRVYRLRADGSA